MATLIIEDGTRIDGANSYVSTAEFNQYLVDRGLTVAGDSSQLLLLSMDYLETQMFIGIKLTEEQTTQWPRAYAYIDTYPVPADEIPKDLKQAQMVIALAIDEGNSPLNLIERKTLREKVDVLEVQYSDGSASNTIDPRINNVLKKLIIGGGSGFTVHRG